RLRAWYPTPCFRCQNYPQGHRFAGARLAYRYPAGIFPTALAIGDVDLLWVSLLNNPYERGVGTIGNLLFLVVCIPIRNTAPRSARAAIIRRCGSGGISTRWSTGFLRFALKAP